MRRVKYSHFPNSLAKARGLTLVELMIALVLGLLLVIAMTAAFIGSSSARREVQLSADAIENGRYGLDLLARELAMAGFYGTLVTPSGTYNNICSQTVTGGAANEDWEHSLQIHVSGLNHGSANPTCLTGRNTNTDAVFIQRTSTCRVGDAGCAIEAVNLGYLQVSECGTEYATLTTPYVVGLGEAATFVLKGKSCTSPPTSSEKRQIIRRIYYVNTSNVLQSVDITPSGAGTPVSLVEGIEQMQLEYAIDSTGDGTPDSYSSTPAAADWPNVVGARLWLLAQSAETSRNAPASMQFVMGDCSYSTNNSLCDGTVGTAPTTPQLKRRLYNTYISFTTPKMRRES